MRGVANAFRVVAFSFGINQPGKCLFGFLGIVMFVYLLFRKDTDGDYYFELTTATATPTEFVPQKCVCEGVTCMCCNHLVKETLKLNHLVCFNFTYLSYDYGVAVTCSVGDQVLFRKIISVKNPPPICVGAPSVAGSARACFIVFDLDWPNEQQNKFKGCLAFQVKLLETEYVRYEFGCFSCEIEDWMSVTPPSDLPEEIPLTDDDDDDNSPKDDGPYVRQILK